MNKSYLEYESWPETDTRPATAASTAALPTAAPPTVAPHAGAAHTAVPSPQHHVTHIKQYPPHTAVPSAGAPAIVRCAAPTERRQSRRRRAPATSVRQQGSGMQSPQSVRL